MQSLNQSLLSRTFCGRRQLTLIGGTARPSTPSNACTGAVLVAIYIHFAIRHFAINIANFAKALLRMGNGETPFTVLFTVNNPYTTVTYRNTGTSKF